MSATEDTPTVPPVTLDGVGELATPTPMLTASRDAPVGGQAVIEGVMMRGVKNWAVASRLPGPEESEELGPIKVQAFELKSSRGRPRWYRLPFVRGVVGLVDSMAIGFRALNIATEAQFEAEDAGNEPADGVGADGAGSGISGGVWAGTIVVAVAFAVGLFFVLPVTLTNLVKHQLGTTWLFWLVEGVVRTAIFFAYLWLLARMRDMKRVLQYHGAEHKTISCYEAGDELTPERAALYSRLHPRCGTSFLLIVMIISIFIFAPIGVPAWWLLVLTRIAGVPVVCGISFEVIKWAGRNRAKPYVQWIIWPGMQLQKLTTAEPSLDQLEVAIASLNAVLERETPGSLSAEDLIGVEVSA